MDVAPPPSQRQPDDRPEDYVGLTLPQARARAEARGWRVVRELDHWPVRVTMEHVALRINLVVTDGHVERCWFG